MGIKDTDLPITPTITVDDWVAIVQEGVNRRIKVSDMFNPDILPGLIVDISVIDKWEDIGQDDNDKALAATLGLELKNAITALWTVINSLDPSEIVSDWDDERITDTDKALAASLGYDLYNRILALVAEIATLRNYDSILYNYILNRPTFSVDTAAGIITATWIDENGNRQTVEFYTKAKVDALIQTYNPPTPTVYDLSVSPTSLSYDAAGESKTIAITSNVSWSITTPSWITASVSGGIGDASVSLVADFNSGSARSGSVVISGIGVDSVTVSVSQSAAPALYLSVSPSSLSYSSSGGTKTLVVEANTSWSLIAPDWVNVSQSSGTGTGSQEITVTALSNEGTNAESRTGTIVFSGTGVDSVSVSLSQAAAVIPTLSISPTSSTVDWQGGTITLNISSNTQWSVSDNQNWISLIGSTTGGSPGGTISVVVASNSSTSGNRTGTVTVQTTSGTPRQTATLSITQTAAPAVMTYAVVLSENSHTFSAAGGVYTLSVQGITYQNGVEISRENLSASSLTITRNSANNPFTRSGLVINAPNLGTTVTTQKSTTWTVSWDGHNCNTTFTSIQEPNIRTEFVAETTWSDRLPNPVVWHNSGTSTAAWGGDYFFVDDNVYETVVTNYYYASGSEETVTQDIPHQGEITFISGGNHFYLNNGLVGCVENTMRQAQTCTMRLTYIRNPQEAPEPYVSDRQLTQAANPSMPTSLVAHIGNDLFPYSNPTWRPAYDYAYRWETDETSGSFYQYVYTRQDARRGDNVYSDSSLTTVIGTVEGIA